MCHNRTNKNKINCLHGRYLFIIYDYKKSSFEDVLAKYGSVSIHRRNLKALAVELFKVLKGLFLQKLFLQDNEVNAILILCYALCQSGQPWIKVPCHT